MKEDEEVHMRRKESSDIWDRIRCFENLSDWEEHVNEVAKNMVNFKHGAGRSW